MAKNNVKREKSKETVEEDESNESVVSGGTKVEFANFTKDNKQGFNDAVVKFNDQVNGSTTDSLKKAIDTYENNNDLNAVKTAITAALKNLDETLTELNAPTEQLTKENLHTYLSSVYAAYKTNYDVVVAKYDSLKTP